MSATDQATPASSTAPARDYIRLFKDYPDREKLLAQVRGAAFDGIELFAGREIRKKVEEAGLAKLHRFYPAEYVNLLQTYVTEKTTRAVIEWSAKVGRHAVGMEDEFYVQDLLVVRLHYPHDEPAADVSEVREPSLALRMRWGFGAQLESLKAGLASRTAFRHPGRMLKYMTQRKSRSTELLPYRCHGPHLDSWLGQPMGSLSVWLGVNGIEQDNTMCLYPETVDLHFGQSASLFLGPGNQLPKPTRPEIEDGDLYVFSTEILHSSQVNISGKTRFALTTRISPATPVFDGTNLWFIERWHVASELLAGRYKCRTIKAAEHSEARPPGDSPAPQTPRVTVASTLTKGQPQAVAKSEDVAEGQRIVVEFGDGKRVMILRLEGTLRAFSASCPHAGYRMDDGHYDGRWMACPGHGLEFDTTTGKSKADCFRLPKFDVSEQDGTILLG
ncbi:MAG TPA: Rieske 2Fe-2S domain-containing protein [bacterium]|nr:Rieske 2Fe-2S domain-containing protein [bacterium]